MKKETTRSTVKYYVHRNEIVIFNAHNNPVGGATGAIAADMYARFLERGINVELINE